MAVERSSGPAQGGPLIGGDEIACLTDQPFAEVGGRVLDALVFELIEVGDLFGSELAGQVVPGGRVSGYRQIWLPLASAVASAIG